MPVICIKCDKMFNFLEELRGNADMNKAVGDILFEKYGSTDIICKECRN